MNASTRAVPQVGERVAVGKAVPVREGYYGVQMRPAVVVKVNRATFDIRIESGCVERYRLTDFGWVVRPQS